MLFLAAPFFFQAAPARRFLTRAAVLFFTFACGWTIFRQPGGSIDLFEDGQLLAPAQVYMTGGRPYLDTYPLHGWGADGGLDGILFRAFGPTLQTFWWRRAAMTALSLAALGAASYLLFGRMSWGGVGLLCALGFCPFVSERHLFIFAALCLLIRAGRNQRGLDWFLAGIASAVTLFFSLDFGLIAVAGGLAAAAILPLLDSKRSVRTSIRRTVVFLGGTGLGSLPFFLLLAREGAFSAFLRVSFREIPGTVTDTWGLPAGSPSAIVAHHGPIRGLFLLFAGEEMQSLFLLILLAAGVTVLLFRSARGVLEPVDRAAGTALAVACLSLRGVLGRADAGHLALYGVFGGLPAAWILYRAAHGGRHRKALTAAVLLLLLVCLRLHRIVALEANAVRHAATALEPAVKALPSRAAARLPRAGPQAEELRALRRYFDATLQPGQTFFDFANQPALYFFLGRVPPIRYACVPFYEPDQKQREVVEALEGVRPPLAILSGGTFLDALDGISNRQRAPLVAAYLDAHYEPAGEVSGRRIGRRKLP